MTDDAPTPDARYRALAAKVDAFFTRVEARHGDAMRCHTGCHDCCHVALTITAVEAAAVAAAWRALPEAARGRTRAGWNVTSETRCAALDPDGRCTVYAGRPLVCRSHGVPIRLRSARSLPVVQACEHNFASTSPVPGPAAADADCILDQETLSAMLLVIDRHAPRVALADVLRAVDAEGQ